MKTGERWSSWKAFIAALLLLHAAGCVVDRAAVEKNLMAHPSAQDADTVAQSYRVACPDIITLEIPQRPEFTGKYEIGADGRIDLGDYGNPRIEGRMLPEVAEVIGAETGVDPLNVKVRVLEFRSQRVLLFGEVAGRQRSVPYRGQETVLDLLRRVGGITPGAAPDDVRGPAPSGRQPPAGSLSRRSQRHRPEAGPADQHPRLAVRPGLRRRNPRGEDREGHPAVAASHLAGNLGHTARRQEPGIRGQESAMTDRAHGSLRSNSSCLPKNFPL